jgi:hypothetical protein
MRRVLAILVVVAALCLSALPGAAAAVAGGSDACSATCRDRLVEMGLEGRVVQLVADADSTCALTERGEVYCWGADHPGPYEGGNSALLLMSIGSLLIAGGATLLLVSRS